MNSFADLVNSGVIHDNTSNYYACKRLSIDEITNKEITILSVVQNIKTEHGTGRFLVHFTSPETGEGKFFTNARAIKDQLAQVPETCFPFTTIVVGIRDGNRKMYKLT